MSRNFLDHIKVSGVVAIDSRTCTAPSAIKSGAAASKSNEITAIPELLEMLEIEGAIVAIVAIGTPPRREPSNPLKK